MLWHQNVTPPTPPLRGETVRLGRTADGLPVFAIRDAHEPLLEVGCLVIRLCKLNPDLEIALAECFLQGGGN